MSADNERRARELLAREYERDGLSAAPQRLRNGKSLMNERFAIRAIMAALDEPAGSVGGEVPAGVWEALQRLIENAATLGPASMEDALLVAKYRDAALTHPAPSVVDEAMVERAARAIYAQQQFPITYDDVHATFREVVVGFARAALTAALTQPSPPGEEG